MTNDFTDSKSKILKASKILFAKNGFDGTSTREIVKVAGVNISLISYYFGSKENVFFALFDNFIIDETINNNHNTEDDVNATDPHTIKEFSLLISRIIKLRFEDPELVTILQQELIMNSKRTEKFKQILLPTWIRVKTLLSNGRNEELFAFQNIENALSCVMAIATFPRQNSMYIDSFIELGDEKEITEETLLFILKGLSFVS